MKPKAQSVCVKNFNSGDYSSLIGLFRFSILCVCACFGKLHFARNLSFKLSNFLV